MKISKPFLTLLSLISISCVCNADGNISNEFSHYAEENVNAYTSLLTHAVPMGPTFDTKTKLTGVKEQQQGVANTSVYLADFVKQCEVDWPKNRMMCIVTHGHSVPAGYHRTPEVKSLESYPHLLHAGLATRFPHAVINVIVTAIGGENAERGAERFEADVLSHRPDVVTIDYCLNDRGLGLERARAAWVKMITAAQAKGIKVILLTPTPDQSAKLMDPTDPLSLHAEQVRKLAAEFHVGLVDSYAEFQNAVKLGTPLESLMSQVNHPNLAGHRLVANSLMKWFGKLR